MVFRTKAYAFGKDLFCGKGLDDRACFLTLVQAAEYLKGRDRDCVESLIFLFKYTWVAAAKSLQSCLTLCDPIDGSPRGFPVPGILQARTLEWVAISFSNE